MMVCLSYDEGWFLRINTTDFYRPCVAIKKADNEFLSHDSHVECALLIIDEDEINETLNKSGIIGRLSFAHKDEILKKLLSATYINAQEKDDLKHIFDESI